MVVEAANMMSSSTDINNNLDDERLDQFQPSQIICLEHAGQRLYVEVIQVLRDRQSAWLRPLCFCLPAHRHNEADDGNTLIETHDGDYFLYDVRQGTDLIWPLSQCRMVLDIEAIPVLAHLGPEPYASVKKSNTRSPLRAFIQEIWNHTQSDPETRN